MLKSNPPWKDLGDLNISNLVNHEIECSTLEIIWIGKSFRFTDLLWRVIMDITAGRVTHFKKDWKRELSRYSDSWCLFTVFQQFSDQWVSVEKHSWGHEGCNYSNHNPKLTLFVSLTSVGLFFINIFHSLGWLSLPAKIRRFWLLWIEKTIVN